MVSIRLLGPAIVAAALTMFFMVRPSEPAPVPSTDPCATLRERLCRDVPNACSRARSEIALFPDARCRKMSGRYGAVKDDLKALGDALESLRPPAGASQSEMLIVVFCDFENADCGRLSPLHRTLETLYENRARLVFRHDPSPKRAHAALAAEASLAANEQRKFWEYHDVLFANPHDLSRKALERYAESLSLDMDRFRRALDEHKFRAHVASDVALARRLRITGTPTVFANAEPIEAPYGVADLARILGRPSVQ